MYCINCGFGGEAADECPRCHAGAAYLLDIPALAQGGLYPINELEARRDSFSGFTNPNLHRRVNDAVTDTKICVCGTNSYRIEESTTHDEESTTSEIP